MFRRAGKFFAGIAATCAFSGIVIANDFEEVSRHLDHGGDYFEIHCTAEINKRLTDCFHEIKSGVAALDLPAEQRTALGGGFDFAESLIEFSGIKEIIATGKSSKSVGNGYFCNRSFYLVKQPSSGMIWNLSSKENTPILDAIGEMPAETMAAFVADFDFTQETFQKQLEKFLTPQIAAMLKESGIGARELATSLSGRWRFLLFPGNSFLCIIPDTQKKAFSFLQGFLSDEYESNENGTLTKDDITIAHDDNCLLINKNFSGFDDGFAKIRDTEFFKTAADHLRSDGVAAYFSAVPREQEIIEIFGIPVNLSAMESNQLGILRKESNGVEMQSVSDMTIPCENLMTVFNLICRALSAFGTAQEAIAEDAENQHDVCQKNLQTIYAALDQYRKKNGAFPTEMQNWEILLQDAPELAASLICPDRKQNPGNVFVAQEKTSYIYFGSWGDFADDTLPIVIDLPGNHTDSFNVLYSDGSVATLEQENITSVRKAASVLHTVNRYDEARFIELMRRAAFIDQLLNLE